MRLECVLFFGDFKNSIVQVNKTINSNVIKLDFARKNPMNELNNNMIAPTMRKWVNIRMRRKNRQSSVRLLVWMFLFSCVCVCEKVIEQQGNDKNAISSNIL